MNDVRLVIISGQLELATSNPSCSTISYCPELHRNLRLASSSLTDTGTSFSFFLDSFVRVLFILFKFITPVLTKRIINGKNLFRSNKNNNNLIIKMLIEEHFESVD